MPGDHAEDRIEDISCGDWDLGNINIVSSISYKSIDENLYFIQINRSNYLLYEYA